MNSTTYSMRDLIHEELNLMLEKEDWQCESNPDGSLRCGYPASMRAADAKKHRAQTGEAGVIDVDETNKDKIVMGDAAHQKQFKLQPGEHIIYRWVGDPSKDTGSSRFTLGKPKYRGQPSGAVATNENLVKRIINEELAYMLNEAKYKVGDKVKHDSDDLGKGTVVAVHSGKKGNIVVRWGSGTKTHHRWALKPAINEAITDKMLGGLRKMQQATGLGQKKWTHRGRSTSLTSWIDELLVFFYISFPEIEKLFLNTNILSDEVEGTEVARINSETFNAALHRDPETGEVIFDELNISKGSKRNTSRKPQPLSMMSTKIKKFRDLSFKDAEAELLDHFRRLSFHYGI